MSNLKSPFPTVTDSQNRLSIAFFFDGEGVVDEYYFFLLREMGKFSRRTVFVSNGPIVESSRLKLEAMGVEIIIRENIGLDVGAYKAAIEYVGYDSLGDFEEILLFNHTFYGPIYPLSEMFSHMDKKECGFWGITAHKAVEPNPFTGDGVMPRHLNSHFIAVRREMAASSEFRDYWEKMPKIESYYDSISKHETRFTKHFEDLGYECVVYDDDRKYSSDYPCFINIDESLENRCPIIKRRLFFHDPVMHESHAIDLPRALRIMRETSDYDENLIWSNIVRTADLRTLNTTAALTSVLPDVRMKEINRTKIKKIAVCCHVYYVDMIGELLDLCLSVPLPFDFIATTDTEAKAQIIRKACNGFPGIGNVIVRVTAQNRGRDIGALFVACRDLFLDDRYDLVCRLHSKKSPQVDSARSNIFKRHLFENLLSSKGYVENVLDMFEEKPWVGVAVPPVVHISYPTLGMAWFSNKEPTIKEAKALGLRVKFDDHTPISAYGSMYWFRPAAIRKLFARGWTWEDFNPEPDLDYGDGDLPHAIERLVTYTAQDAGFLTQQILCANQASYNYAMLEFKHAALATSIRYAFPQQVSMMQQWAAAGNPLPGNSANQMRDGFGFKAVWYDDDNLVRIVPEEIGKKLIDEKIENSKNYLQGFLSTISNGGINKISERFATFERDVDIIADYMQRVGYVNWHNFDSSRLIESIKEYLMVGWATGKDIFSLFDTEFYIRRYGDVRRMNINPFVHYIMVGAQEGRQPHPLFDPVYYEQNLSRHGVPSNGRDLMITFLAMGTESQISPHPLFDMSYYYNTYQEVSQFGLNALVHYIRYGSRERRRPHILFDQDYYEAGIGTCIPEDINPLIHYLDVGSRYGVDTHPLFDSLYYAKSVGKEFSWASALTHYLSVPAEQRGAPHPLFDGEWYRRRQGGTITMCTELEHYLKEGSHGRENPHPSFDGRAYLNENAEVAALGVDPLVHYVKYGAWENRKIPGFDEVAYRRRAKLKKKDGLNLFVHYLKYEYAQRAVREYALV